MTLENLPRLADTTLSSLLEHHGVTIEVNGAVRIKAGSRISTRRILWTRRRRTISSGRCGPACLSGAITALR